ncbi:MAG TPA: hypothetical protein VFG62_08810 [Rhodopila sp.]|nr:hypothetical protein [Rhodopila sp.]
MQRVTDPSVATALPPVNSTGSPGYFTDGDTTGGVSATIVTQDWLNGVQEELVGLVEGVGETPSMTTLTQVAQAIRRYAGGNVTTVDASTTLTADNAGLVLVNASAGNVVITMPAVAGAGGIRLPFAFMRTDESVNTVTVETASTDTIWPSGTSSISVAGLGQLTLIGNGSSQWLNSGRSAPGPVVSLTAAATLTAANNGALVEQSAPSTITTTMPTPVGNPGLRYRFFANGEAQILETPAGGFDGPAGSGAATLTVPNGQIVVLVSDGSNWVVSGNYAALNGNAAQPFNCAPNSNPNSAVTLAQMLGPMAAYASAAGNADTVTASVSFTAPGPGLLLGWGAKNVSNANSTVGDVDQLYINGVQVANDATQASASHFASVRISAGGAVSAEYTASYGLAFTAWVQLIYIPIITSAT